MHSTAQRFDGETVAMVVRDAAARVRKLRASGSVQLISAGPEGPTTSADLAIQDQLVKQLVTLFGPAEIVAEEGAYRARRVSNRAPLTWIIDPLDGTTSYISGRDTYGVQLAAYGDGRLLGGWIVCPDLGWTVTAWENGPLRIEGIDSFETTHRVLIADGDFDAAHLTAIARKGFPEYLRSFSCAVDYSLVTAGILDWAMYRRAHPWDHAPGAYLVYRSGGSSLRWSGLRYDPAVDSEGIFSAAAHVDIGTLRSQLLRG